jgi:hypothetical protein
MSAATVLLITLAAVTPVLTLSLFLYVWIQRHQQPDFARIKVFRGLLWFIFCLILGLLAAEIILGPPTSIRGLLLTVFSLLFLAANFAFQIHLCQRRLRNNFPGRPNLHR